MARPKIKAIDSEESDERAPPVRTMIGLAVGFLVIVGVAVWTVLLPELADDAAEEEDGRQPAAEAPPAPPTT